MFTGITEYLGEIENIKKNKSKKTKKNDIKQITTPRLP